MSFLLCYFIPAVISEKGIQNYPFPAITFHPGDEHFEKGFLRTFLNQFQLTRYEDGIMQDNEEFLELFRWLIGPMNNILFDGIEKHLLEEPRFINSKVSHQKNEGNLSN